MANNPLQHYATSPADWRKTIRQNTNKTYVIIGIFFLMYCLIGLLVDMYVDSLAYPAAQPWQLFYALITFQLFPLATIVMFGVAAISLFVAYTLHDQLMLLGTEYHEITPDTAQSASEQQLYNTVEEMKIAAGLRYMPKVYIINADYMNAFASGYSEKSAMVAITRGLMDKLNRDELQAVMAHELSHIRHLDIKLTLTASLLANLIIMVLDMLFYNAMFSNRRDSENRSSNRLLTIIIIVRYLLPVISIILLLYLSRTRELMADAGAVELMRSNEPLANALIKISGDHVAHREAYAAAYANTPHENVRREAYIFDPHQAGFQPLTSLNDLFSTHPSLEARLAALGFKKKN
jgi:heat shock protein HtpX